MAISVFDLFSVGIGPSSSHTVGPMRAALRFVEHLRHTNVISDVAHLKVDLYGSLGATGRGHGSDKAVVLGLLGETPESVDPYAVGELIDAVKTNGRISLDGAYEVAFDIKKDLKFLGRKSLPFHPNGMRCFAFDSDGATLAERDYYSIGGGFVVNDGAAGADKIVADETVLPHPFSSGDELLQRCEETRLSVSSLMLENERVWRSDQEIRNGLLDIWSVMKECVSNGITNTGFLPGKLHVKRRAADFYQDLSANPEKSLADPLTVIDWVNLYALAVNEENAAGGRVVTAPTNGAAGIIPAVMHYYDRFVQGSTDDGIVRFLLTAGAIGVLYKTNASISGAEVGCQGEVGSACSMAAGALCEVSGGTPAQVENAAEIAMEHNLGLTCDPVGGLVQVPCIERNAIAATKAINASRLALRGDGTHFVSLDKVIKTMRETGADMKTKYKETSRGGLAVNVIEC